jgi:hypothetical protein
MENATISLIILTVLGTKKMSGFHYFGKILGYSFQNLKFEIHGKSDPIFFELPNPYHRECIMIQSHMFIYACDKFSLA